MSAASADETCSAARRRTTPLCAIAIVPPAHQWGPVQEVRRKFDKAFGRWMPHINFLFPCVTEEELLRHKKEVDAAVQAVGTFQLTFTELDFFSNDRRSGILWAKPETTPCGRLELLHMRLLEVFPQCERQDHGFTPHMTLGQFPAKQIAQKKALYEPSIIDNFTFEVSALQFLARTADGPFNVVHNIPLEPGHPWGGSSDQTDDTASSWADETPPCFDAADAARPEPADVRRKVAKLLREVRNIDELQDPVFCCERVTAILWEWLVNNPVANYPKSSDALRAHLGLLGRIRARADHSRVFDDLCREGFISKQRVRRPRKGTSSPSPPPGGRGRGRGGRAPARGRGGRASPGDPNTFLLRVVALHDVAAPGGARPSAPPQQYADVLGKARAWVGTLRKALEGKEAVVPEDAFMKGLGQVCTVSVPVPPDRVLQFLLDHELVRVRGAALTFDRQMLVRPRWLSDAVGDPTAAA